MIKNTMLPPKTYGVLHGFRELIFCIDTWVSIYDHGSKIFHHSSECQSLHNPKYNELKEAGFHKHKELDSCFNKRKRKKNNNLEYKI